MLSGLVACEEQPLPSERRIIGANPEEGRLVITEVECGVCHRIPGIAGANGIVGPPLEGFSARPLIAGVHANQPDNLVRWIRNAPGMTPNTAMPDFDLTDTQARDVAAYLYTLR